MVRQPFIALSAFALLGACATIDLSDPRTQLLMQMPGPMVLAERDVASDLVRGCPAYRYDKTLGDGILQGMAESGRPVSNEMYSAAPVEVDVKKRTLAARYGAESYGALDPCAVLEAESTAGTPLSVLVQKR